MSHIPRMTMIGMYNFDSTLFEGVSLPDGARKDLFIHSFLLEYGECRVLYPDVDFMKNAIRNFFLKWQSSIESIYTALTEEYNPLHNYDRYEDNELNMLGTISLKQGGTIETGYDALTDERTVSAFNESTYQPDSKNERNGTSTDTYDKTDTTTRNAKDIDKKHMYGNIGVTTSQQMLEAELSLRETQNFYHIVSEMLYKEVCLYYF